MLKPEIIPTFKRLGLRNFTVLGLMIASAVSDTIGNDTLQSSIRIKLPQGEIEGRVKETTRSLAFQEGAIKYFSFEGIPYGVPPIGKLRFKAPVPAGKWRGVYDATRLKPHCAQITEADDVFNGQEDCLHVNVYSRNLNPDRLRPVFLILHGGRFRNGGAEYHNSVDLILELNPVIVSFNYRLGVLGLLSLETEEFPGNMQSKDQLLALTKQPVQRLVRGVVDFENKIGDLVFQFAPVLEKTYKNGTAFLPRTPHSTYETGQFNDVPTIISYTSKEFAFYVDGDNLQSFISRVDGLIPPNWKIPIHSKLFNETLFRIKQFYFGGQQIDLTNHDDMENYVQLMGDIRFANYVIEVARTHVTFAESPLYLYRFSYRGGLNNPNIDRLGIQGACHADERVYIFPLTDKKISLKSSDNFVTRRHLMIYKNFMETSNPTPASSILLPEIWPPYTSDRKEFLHIDGDAVVCRNPDKRKTQFWTDLEEYVIKEGGFDRDWKKHACIMK